MMNYLNKGSAIIVGASLSGLMTAISLAKEDINVTVLDKVSDKQRTGAGLKVDSGGFELSKTARLLRQLASGGKSSVQLWSSIEKRLRKEVETYPNITLIYHSRVEAINQTENYVSVVTEAGDQYKADILIGADGHRSLVRHYIAPNKAHATYAGYVVWIIDPINESIISKTQDTSHLQTGVQMLSGLNGFMFGSVIDDQDGAGNRRIGSAWYDNSRTEILRDIGAVTNNVVNHSLDGPDIPQELINELKQDASNAWPEPFLTATLYALENRKLTGIPIKEYVPDTLFSGRIAIIGDAAHVPAPITASGFNESLNDAVALGKAVSKGITGNNAINALKTYESDRLNKVKRMVQSGQSFSRSFGRL